MFKEYRGNIDYDALEREILKFWDENSTFPRTLAQSKGKPTFAFYEGPPTANGKPGIHHVISRTIKDLICRYKTMTGHHVERKAGWDTHGLPVEIQVEKQLNISEKEEIIAYGVDKFNEKCRESVFTYKQEWDDLTRRIGYWLDLENPYITFTNDYIETLWHILQQFWQRELIYKGFKILPYCPRCETPLSSHEVSQGYKDVKDPSIYVKMRLIDQPDTAFLVWTTTPWTLAANTALAVGEDITYVKINTRGENLILAKSRLEAVDADYEILEEMTGKALLGIHYEPLMGFLEANGKDVHYVLAGEFVSTEDGSGIVHIAPAFGEDDYQIGRRYDLPVFRPVDESGCYTAEITPWAGKFVKHADSEIIAYLREQNKLYRKQSIEHSYPHCWRCDTPLIYYARDSWYIETTRFKEQLIANNEKVNWYPPEVGAGRFGEWLNNNIDWAISRDRFWGTPLNIWICEDCGHRLSIGSIAELKALSTKPLRDAEIDLHKHFVDQIQIECQQCSGLMQRTPEVVDVWFDSGAMPFAQWHYPFANQSEFEAGFPADFICEGIDQTRGWFYSLLAISTMLTGQVAYRNVVVNELILDREGRKMSKRLGNTVDPVALIKRYGVDAIRWYMIYLSPPWVTKRFDEEGVSEAQRKFFGTLLNVYSFFAMYANVDRFTQTDSEIEFSSRPEIDRWILSRLYSLIDDVGANMEGYRTSRAARLIHDYVIDELSNWYVRRNRRRFWKAELGQDKLSAYQTLYTVLYELSRLIAPFTPFFAEELFQNLRKDDSEHSVHMLPYPNNDDTRRKHIDSELQRRMALTQKLVAMVRTLRNDVQIKVRQPLAKILVHTQAPWMTAAIDAMQAIIIDEINVKQVVFVDDLQSLATISAKPNFKALGKRAGKYMRELNEKIRSLDGDLLASLQKDEDIDIPLSSGENFILAASEIEFVSNPKPDLLVSTDDEITVALDVHIDEELKREGIARELVNRIQNLRKDSQLHLTDRIALNIEVPEQMHEAIQAIDGYIRAETLAVDMHISHNHYPMQADVSIEGMAMRISLQKTDKE
jgi:isoleucyl-tRNA synthetase